MKLKLFIFLIGLFSFFHLNAAAATLDVLPAFALNPEGLAKPATMKCMQWLETLETERNRADCIGNFQAFKAFTKEISATIGGKYGISKRAATPEERAALLYSIARTRHKFCGQENMLATTYAVGEVSGLEAHAKGHLAAVLAVDIMAKKAMDDEGFANQWAAVKPVSPAAASFIAAVKQYAGAHEKASVVAALQEPLDKF